MGEPAPGELEDDLFAGRAGVGAAVSERSGLTGTVQYRIVLGKKDEIVIGPDDADVVITVPRPTAGRIRRWPTCRAG